MGTLDTVQQEQLRAIGTYLSQIRQEQARSLEDIATKTYIPLRLLKAIEAGQDKPLPEPVFIQGFIRRYADALGLDGMDLSQRFPVHVTPLPMDPATTSSQERSLRNATEPSRQVNRPASRPSNSQANYSANSSVNRQSNYRSSYQTQQAEEPSTEQPSRQWPASLFPYLAAAGVLALGGLALGIVKAISSKQPETPSAVVLPEQPVPATNAPSTNAPTQRTQSSSQAPATTKTDSSSAASPSPSVSPSVTPSASTSTSQSTSASKPKPAAAANRDSVKVEMNLTDASWIQVIVDGEVKAESVLPKGTRQSWSGKEEITIVAGNAGAVAVSQNGETPKTMGALGDVVERTFKKGQ